VAYKIIFVKSEELNFMNLNQRCCHYDECGNEAVYELHTVGGVNIFVCESCDEDYSSCQSCGHQDIYEEMYRAHFEDKWPTCHICHDKLRAEFDIIVREDVTKFLSKAMPDYYKDVPEWFANEMIAFLAQISDYYVCLQENILLAFQISIIKLIRRGERNETI